MSDNYVGNGPGSGLTSAMLGVPGGIATLDGSGKVPTSQLQGAGRLLQALAHDRSDWLSTGLSIPVDDTIPQITEGVEWFSVVFTPQMPGASRVRVALEASLTGSAGGANMIWAIFRSDQANAIAAGDTHAPGASYRLRISQSVEILAPAGTVTFSARFGQSSGTLYLNGNTTNRLFGGVHISSLRVKEFSP